MIIKFDIYNTNTIYIDMYFIYGSGHETVAILLPGFAII